MVLQRPFPLDTPSRQTFRYTFYAALCVFLILALLQPFGIDQLSRPTRFLHAGLYGLVTFIIATLNTFLLPLLFPVAYREEKWTVGKELLHVLASCFYHLWQSAVDPLVV